MSGGKKPNKQVEVGGHRSVYSCFFVVVAS